MADFTIGVSNINAADSDAATYIVEAENERRAAADPPETPLPYATGAELKASYLAMLESIIDRAHASYQKQSATKKLETENVKTLWQTATEAQRAAAVAALTP